MRRGAATEGQNAARCASGDRGGENGSRVQPQLRFKTFRMARVGRDLLRQTPIADQPCEVVRAMVVRVKSPSHVRE